MLLPRMPALALLLAARALACVAVEQDRVLAKDLVREHAWFASLDPDLEIARTPLAGIKRVIKTGELAAVARRIQVAAPPALPAAPCIERASALLTPERLQPVLEQALGRSPVNILDYSRDPAPRGEIEFPRAGLSGAGLWRGRVRYGQGHSFPVWAKISLPSGESDSGAAQAPSVLPRGVERGERITVEVTSGAARLAFQATAESAGHAGSSVLVRNPESGRLFPAKVLGNGKVLIQK